MVKHYLITVHGRVQGVGFRYAARNKARELGVTGWVENQSDGTVKAAVQGNADQCNAFIRWCREGTGYSWVEKIDLQEVQPGDYAGFTIRHRGRSG